jgi:Raf kinase inhibitor-like YbhB/YbcL family protein
MDSHRVWCLSYGAFLLAGFAGLVRADNFFSISSPDFQRGMLIPGKYGFHQQNISPELRVANAPGNTRSLVLIVDDPDAPAGFWTHWLVWNLPSEYDLHSRRQAAFGSCCREKTVSGMSVTTAPRLRAARTAISFRLYALDTTLSLPEGSNRAALEQAMKGHIVGSGETFGVYSASP